MCFVLYLGIVLQKNKMYRRSIQTQFQRWKKTMRHFESMYWTFCNYRCQQRKYHLKKLVYADLAQDLEDHRSGLLLIYKCLATYPLKE